MWLKYASRTVQSASPLYDMLSFFFFQAEDGIRDLIVTGVQTCALPISTGDPRKGDASRSGRRLAWSSGRGAAADPRGMLFGQWSESHGPRAERPPDRHEIGRASCRERV